MQSEIIGWTDAGGVRLLDQTRLPGEVTHVDIDTVEGMVEAIQSLRVRGAPLIGIAAAMGIAAAAERERRVAVSGGRDNPLTGEWFNETAERIAGARPTAVNLRWAVERVRRIAARAVAEGAEPEGVVRAVRAEAQHIWDEDAAMCQAIGESGASRITHGATVLTHCNAGRLATGGIGTALGAVYAARDRGKDVQVVACEARPLNQGSRLTAWELHEAGISCRVVVDSAAAFVMSRGDVDLVIVGADRIAANGDTANKIGTYSLAVAARAHGIPFYVAAPHSTVDLESPSGESIPIEVRDPAEIPAAKGAEAFNPAFDVTPGSLISAFLTDRGVVVPPFDEALRRLWD